MHLESDRKLLEGYRRGDRATLEALYRHYSAPVLRSLSKGFRVRHQGGADTARVTPLDLDAAHQEAFIRIFSESARRHYNGLQPFEPYVIAIARSAAVDVLRAQGKVHRDTVAIDDADGLFEDAGESPEQQAVRAEAESVVKRFLSTLSPQDLEFATARFIDGDSQQKAGERCGLSRQEARTREAKLRAECLAFLRTQGFSDTAPGAPLSALTGIVFTLLGLSLSSPR